MYTETRTPHRRGLRNTNISAHGSSGAQGPSEVRRSVPMAFLPTEAPTPQACSSLTTESEVWGLETGYSGSLLLVVFSHSMLSSLCVGEAPGGPAGRTRSPWKRRHSGQMRMWLQPRAARAASCASLWGRGSGRPVPVHSLPLLRLAAVARARRSSKARGRGRKVDEPPRRRRSCRLSWHSTMPCSSRSISSHTDSWEKYTHEDTEREREARGSH